MIVPLKIEENGMLSLSAVISSKHYHMGFSRIVFLVDTGSPETFISESDALRLKLPIKSLEFDKYGFMASSKFKILKGKPVTLYIKDDQDKSQKIETKINVVQNTSKTQEDKEVSYSFPSIIGMDFLKNHNFSLHVFSNKNLAYLEKEIQ